MSFYPEEIAARFKQHGRLGAIENATTAETSASFACGSFATVSLRIDTDTSTIADASFQTNGCGFMTAAADVLCEGLAGKTLGDLRGLLDTELTQSVCGQLGEFPPERMQCAAVVFEALRSALARYRTSRIEEFQGEKALICTCFGISEEALTEIISAEKLTTVSDVSRLSKAGTGCGSCRMLIQELIDSRS